MHFLAFFEFGESRSSLDNVLMVEEPVTMNLLSRFLPVRLRGLKLDLTSIIEG